VTQSSWNWTWNTDGMFKLDFAPLVLHYVTNCFGKLIFDDVQCFCLQPLSRVELKDRMQHRAVSVGGCAHRLRQHSSPHAPCVLPSATEPSRRLLHLFGTVWNFLSGLIAVLPNERLTVYWLLHDPTLLLRVLAVLGLYATSRQFIIIIIIIMLQQQGLLMKARPSWSDMRTGSGHIRFVIDFENLS